MSEPVKTIPIWIVQGQWHYANMGRSDFDPTISVNFDEKPTAWEAEGALARELDSRGEHHVTFYDLRLFQIQATEDSFA